MMKHTPILSLAFVFCSALACGGPEGADFDTSASAQLDPGFLSFNIVSIYEASSGIEVARVLAANTSHAPFVAGQEYWNVLDLGRLQRATALRWVNAAGPQTWPSGTYVFPYSFHTAVNTWQATTAAPSGTHLAGADASGETLVVDFSRLTNARGAWGGEIDYWYTTNAHLVSFGATGAGAFSTSSTSRYPTASWYTIVSVPGI